MSHVLDYAAAKLWMTQDQFRFLVGNQGKDGILSAYASLAASDPTDFINPVSPDLWPITSPEWSQYNTSGDKLDVSRGLGTGQNVWLVPYAPHEVIAGGPGDDDPPPTDGGIPFLPPADPPLIQPPAIVPGGALFSPIPPIVNPLVPISGGIAVWQLVWQLVRKAASGGLTSVGGGGNLMSKVLALIGGLSILDFFVDRGIDSDMAEIPEKFIQALAMMEAEGIIHPWRPRPRRDGSVDAGPEFLIFNMIQIQGFYTNFHMSRSGLQSHDDKQDTLKRPKQARRVQPGKRR